MRKRISDENAREIAISALSHIASDDDRMGRFLALTGLAPEDLRNAANNPGFFVAVLDYFMGFEPDLLEFAEKNQLDPQLIVDARAILAGPEEAW